MIYTRYTRLPDGDHHGSILERHLFTTDSHAVEFLCDTGDDEWIMVLVNNIPWGRLALDHPIFNGVDLGSPLTLSKVAEYVIEKVTTCLTC
jgi:hypothetical protein